MLVRELPKIMCIMLVSKGGGALRPHGLLSILSGRSFATKHQPKAAESVMHPSHAVGFAGLRPSTQI